MTPEKLAQSREAVAKRARGRLLWARSRHDSDFRESLVRVACAYAVEWQGTT